MLKYYYLLYWCTCKYDVFVRDVPITIPVSVVDPILRLLVNHTYKIAQVLFHQYHFKAELDKEIDKKVGSAIR